MDEAKRTVCVGSLPRSGGLEAVVDAMVADPPYGVRAGALQGGCSDGPSSPMDTRDRNLQLAYFYSCIAAVALPLTLIMHTTVLTSVIPQHWITSNHSHPLSGHACRSQMSVQLEWCASLRGSDSSIISGPSWHGMRWGLHSRLGWDAVQCLHIIWGQISKAHWRMSILTKVACGRHTPMPDGR